MASDNSAATAIPSLNAGHLQRGQAIPPQSASRRMGRGLGAGILLSVVLLLTSGCVYLRLLELKRQLADFDRYIAVDASDGLKFRFKKPVLLAEDMATLGVAPASRQRSGAAERWYFRWMKEPMAADGDGVRYEQTLDLVFAEGKLTTVVIPEKFFAFVPKPLLLSAVKAMGNATVDRERRRATAAAATNETLPPLHQANLSAMLGAPVESSEAAGARLWRYAFKPLSDEQKAGPLDVTFTIDAATGDVTAIRGKLVGGSFEIDYAELASAPRG